MNWNTFRKNRLLQKINKFLIQMIVLLQSINVLFHTEVF